MILFKQRNTLHNCKMQEQICWLRHVYHNKEKKITGPHNNYTNLPPAALGEWCVFMKEFYVGIQLYL